MSNVAVERVYKKIKHKNGLKAMVKKLIRDIPEYIVLDAKDGTWEEFYGDKAKRNKLQKRTIVPNKVIIAEQYGLREKGISKENPKGLIEHCIQRHITHE